MLARGEITFEGQGNKETAREMTLHDEAAWVVDSSKVMLKGKSTVTSEE